ncbi:MAG: hypothetical protein L6Q99_01790 [Planctomycetes bacterium]|nr:hypothetical protein [Planctomycetota bacterium]
MSELPRRPNDHLVEPMFAALDHHRGDGERVRTSGDVPRRAPSAARVLFWLAIVCAAGATVWITLAS